MVRIELEKLKLNWELQSIEFSQALNFLLQNHYSLPNSRFILNFSRVLSVCRPSVHRSVCLHMMWTSRVQSVPGFPGSSLALGCLSNTGSLCWASAHWTSQGPHIHKGMFGWIRYTATHTPLLCLFDSTNVIWHLNWVREVPVWAQTVDGDSSREPLHYPAEATETIRNNKCSMSWWWGVWRKGTNSFRRLKPHILSPFNRRRIFELKRAVCPSGTFVLMSLCASARFVVSEQWSIPVSKCLLFQLQSAGLPAVSLSVRLSGCLPSNFPSACRGRRLFLEAGWRVTASAATARVSEQQV